MVRNHDILYWFRGPVRIEENNFSGLSLEECRRLIPVYCFDQRERLFFKDERTFMEFHKVTIEAIEILRYRLQLKGSNLLIVNGKSDMFIPSLSRVLNVDKVVASGYGRFMEFAPSELTGFMDKLTLEISHHLRMHSIPMQLERVRNSPNTIFSDIDFLPTFPEINPGNIPTISAF